MCLIRHTGARDGYRTTLGCILYQLDQRSQVRVVGEKLFVYRLHRILESALVGNCIENGTAGKHFLLAGFGPLFPQFALEKGGRSDIVRSPFGFHIIELTDIRPEVARPFEEARAELLAEYLSEQRSELFYDRSELLANLVQLGRDLKERIDELGDEFRTHGIGFEIGFDAAEMVEDQLDRLKQLALWGFAIALVVLWLFLRGWRATLLIATAIPISLLTTFVVLKLTGRSLNVISLAGLAFAVGMVVDNAIVVLGGGGYFAMQMLSPEPPAARRPARRIALCYIWIRCEAVQNVSHD